MHVARIKSSHVDKQGRRREYQSVYLRRSYRQAGTVKHEQLANLSALPEAAIGAIEAVLRGQVLAPVGEQVRIVRAVPHGHVAAVWAQAAALGLPGLLGPPCRERDLALALIVSRVARPASKLATIGWWADSTLGADLGVAGASSDECYQAMDWLLDRQDGIEARLAARHLAPAANPSRLALFDLSSSWVEGSHCPLAARGYSRDGKKGKAQIEYGLLTDPEGRPVAVRVFPGNTADPTAFVEAVEAVREKFTLRQMVMVGDRGMITSARIEALRELGGIGLSKCRWIWRWVSGAPPPGMLTCRSGVDRVVGQRIGSAPRKLCQTPPIRLLHVGRRDRLGDAVHRAPPRAADRGRTAEHGRQRDAACVPAAAKPGG